MHTLKIEYKTTSHITASGRQEHMKEVHCHVCNKAIRFLFVMPNLCPDCMTISDFPEHMFFTVYDRVRYYKDGNA